MHASFIVCIPPNDKEAPEVANIMHREHNRILLGSVIIIDNYCGSQRYEMYCSQLRAIYPITLTASVTTH